MLDIDIELDIDMELDVVIELNVDREVDAEFDVELGMVFVELDTVDAGLIDEPIPRLEPALLPDELGTQHSARLERQNNEKVCNTYFGTLANRTPPWNEEPPSTVVGGTHAHALAVWRTTCPVVDASRALRGCN